MQTIRLPDSEPRLLERPAYLAAVLLDKHGVPFNKLGAQPCYLDLEEREVEGLAEKEAALQKSSADRKCSCYEELKAMKVLINFNENIYNLCLLCIFKLKRFFVIQNYGHTKFS